MNDSATFNHTLTTHAFYILLAIGDGQIRGYDIIGQIAHDSHGQLSVATGSLYPALKHLARSGFIESHTAPDSRLVYRLTPSGRTKLLQEAIRLGEIAIHARYKLGEQVLRMSESQTY